MSDYQSAYTGQEIDSAIGKANTAVQLNDLSMVATSGSYNDLSNKPNLSEKENASNKVTSISSSSTHTQYPSAKAVYELFNTIIDGDEVNY